MKPSMFMQRSCNRGKTTHKLKDWSFLILHKRLIENS